MAGGSAVPFLSIPFYNADYDNVQQQQQQPSPYSNKSQRSIEISTLKTLGGHVGLSTWWRLFIPTRAPAATTYTHFQHHLTQFSFSLLGCIYRTEVINTTQEKVPAGNTSRKVYIDGSSSIAPWASSPILFRKKRKCRRDLRMRAESGAGRNGKLDTDGSPILKITSNRHWLFRQQCKARAEELRRRKRAQVSRRHQFQKKCVCVCE